MFGKRELRKAKLLSQLPLLRCFDADDVVPLHLPYPMHAIGLPHAGVMHAIYLQKTEQSSNTLVIRST